MTKGICRHLESKLPSLVNGKISQDSMKNYSDYYGSTMTMDEYEDECFKLERALRSIGLNKTEVNLYMDRIVSGMSIDELSVKYGTGKSVMDGFIKVLSKKLIENKDKLLASIRSENEQ